MPNWVDTSFEIRGPRTELARFLDGIKEVEGTKRIIESYLPCPTELRETTSTFVHASIPEKWIEWVTDGSWTQEQYDERVAENRKLAEQQDSNIAKFGHKDWYDWEYTNWGTKWGDCHTDIHEFGEKDTSISGSFDTAWGPAEEAFLRISEMFPELTFIFTYDEEAGFFAGIQVFRNGESVFDSMYEPCSYEEEIDWDDDESIAQYENWKDQNLEEISQEFDKFMAGAGA